MEIQPVVRDARRASEPAVRALAMNSVGVSKLIVHSIFYGVRGGN